MLYYYRDKNHNLYDSRVFFFQIFILLSVASNIESNTTYTILEDFKLLKSSTFLNYTRLLFVGTRAEKWRTETRFPQIRGYSLLRPTIAINPVDGKKTSSIPDFSQKS